MPQYRGKARCARRDRDVHDTCDPPAGIDSDVDAWVCPLGEPPTDSTTTDIRANDSSRRKIKIGSLTAILLRTAV